ncbi:MAG: NHL repeat-containing protein, partial [Planctomycetota bacterium]
GNITADFRGFGQKSDLWVVGDRAPELIQFGNDGTVKKVHIPNSTDSSYGSVAIDANNNIWISSWARNNLVHFDSKTGKVLKNLSVTVPIGVAMDGRGKVLVTSRLANAASPPSLLLRYNPKTYVLEQKTTVGGGPSRAASSNFQNALVVDPFGDADGDSVANFAEVTNGTSAFDPQSNNGVDLRVEGSNRIGSTVSIEIRGFAGTKAVLGFATKRLTTPLTNPAWKGALRIDPNSLLPVFIFANVPSTFTGLTIPNDPKIVGTILHMQALHETSPTAAVEWSNDSCVKVFQ